MKTNNYYLIGYMSQHSSLLANKAEFGNSLQIHPQVPTMSQIQAEVIRKEGLSKKAKILVLSVSAVTEKQFENLKM